MSETATFPFDPRPKRARTAARPQAVQPAADRGPLLIDPDHANRNSRISSSVLRSSVLALEFLIIVVSGLAIAVSYVTEPSVFFDVRYLTAFITVAVTTLAAYEFMGLYTQTAFASHIRQLPRLVLGWTASIAAFGAMMFFLKVGADFSRAWLAMWFVTGGFLLLAERMVLAALTHKWAREGRLYRRAVIYGAGQVTDTVIGELEADTGSDIRITGIFDDREDGRARPAIAGYDLLGGLDDLVALCRKSRVDLIIVALPIAGEERLSEIVEKLAVLPADIKLPAKATAIRFSPRTYSHVGSVAMIDLYEKPITDWGTISKWVFDKVVGFTAVVLLAPVMAAVAIAIKLESKGPVLFRQKRYGFNNELIEVLKFRSMYVDQCDVNAAKLVTKHDPRVTRVGRFIRKTSLDELPQLFNVLNGTLSLVGPRPHALQAKAGDQLYDVAVDGYFARHKVKPGITGWAQINGWRGETDTQEKIANRVACDLYYIENWSVLFDLYILIKTPFSLLKNENAY
jgi:Undecaprenyl-phosphate glucose phosphotransferase